MQLSNIPRPDAGAYKRRLCHDRITVLVVEEERKLSGAVRRSLREECGDGAEIVRAAGLAAGLLAVAERKIDVILLDPFLCGACCLESTIMMVRGARAVPIILAVPSGAEAFGLRALRFGVLAMMPRDTIGEQRLLPQLRWAIEHHARLQSCEQRSRELALRQAVAHRGVRSACCSGRCSCAAAQPIALAEKLVDQPSSAEAA